MRPHLVRVRLTDQELHDLDLIATERGQTKSTVLRSAIVAGGSTGAGRAPLDRAEWETLLGARCRDGDVAALRLWHATHRGEPDRSVIPEQFLRLLDEPDQTDPFADVVDVANRRRPR